jgi:hypothetical protein
MSYAFALCFTATAIFGIQYCRLYRHERVRRTRQRRMNDVHELQIAHLKAQHDADLHATGLLVRASVDSLDEIRADIVRNFCETDMSAVTHAASLFNREPLACISIEHVPAALRSVLIQQDVHPRDDLLYMSDIVDLAWRIHAKSRSRADGLFQVIVSSPRAGGKSLDERRYWLAKTLARFEQMCGSEDEAIRQLRALMDVWTTGEAGLSEDIRIAAVTSAVR